ncbi:Yip1 domain containing protein [Parasponia andersonii]|uniref:Protein YIP n=1 Tax=Parasponia andersonii TaxID=3476 RepID=A0A2P5ALC5_PARAD|nr:Yip1 domain containing protein [Parasponia andersonii]
MDDSLKNLPTSHLLGSVPAVISEEKEKSTTSYDVPEANMQIFPPNNGGDRGRGYQTLGSPSPSEGFEQQPANNWRGVFSISSYTQYFNVDTDIVLNRLLSALHPIGGDFFAKIDANPDLYGLIWISTTLVFVLASLGNCATYLMQKHTNSGTSWSFNVNYVNVAAGSVYGYAAVVPLAFYFLLQYMGSNPSLVKFWCMWGYSLFIFVLASFLLVIPVEFLRWMIILLTGAASACFVGSNLKSYVEGSDLTIVVVAAFTLQLALAVFIKVWFFP